MNDITTLKDVRAFASKIVKYVNDGKCPGLTGADYLGVGLKSSYTLGNGQYLIAIRVMSDVTRASDWDFHAIVQLNNGQWINKHGLVKDIETLGYVNPDDTLCRGWIQPDTQKCYSSDTVYIRISTK